MKIAFATTQTQHGSTMVGRVLPLARYLARQHNVHVLKLSDGGLLPANIPYSFHTVGREPFTRSPQGKRRLSGGRLVANMLSTALRTAVTLWRLDPTHIVVVKTLPANVLGARLAKILSPRAKIIVDMDDFELTANTLTTLLQRAAVHWSERAALRRAAGAVAASPFLADHIEQLTGFTLHATVIPTGLPGRVQPATSSATPKTAIRLLYIGSVSINSGHRVDILPAVLAQLQRSVSVPVHIRIAGDGDDVENLRRAFTEQSLTSYVEWTGRFQLSDVPTLLTDVDIVLDPIDDSIAQRAKSSFRVAVAVATGLPVITSNIGIRPHLIPASFHKRFFAEPLNATSYAAQIKALIDAPLTAAEHTALRDNAEHFQEDTLGKNYEDFLGTL